MSPKLLMCRDLELAVPGTYDPNQPIIRIQSIAPSLQVITSKQRPRKLTLMGKREQCPPFLCDICTATCGQTVLALCRPSAHHLVESCALSSRVLVTLSVVSQVYNSCNIYVLLSNACFTCQHRDHSNLSKKYLALS